MHGHGKCWVGGREAGVVVGRWEDLSAALKTGLRPPPSRRGGAGATGGSWLARTLQNASPARLAVVAGILFTAIVGLLVALVVILSRAGR